ncbi:DUF362 domain-containing protein [Dethiothermospora halolimnae]|uniref:DUF362 domain-containing protein n=1 Tax=Dethiothermospora halolimnae TaxID=3114390 RepID=UPI003CCC0900
MKEKVSLVKCEDYEYSLVKESILTSFENIGGIEKYINKGDKVLLKLNLLMRKRPEEATTTHPVFTKALAEVLIEYGAKVIIGDSPGGPFNTRMLKSIYKGCGIEDIKEELDIELNYNTNSMEVKNEEGKILKKLTVVEMLKDVDKVISVSKLKTHGMAMFTGAVKNMFGIIPGVLKAEYHFKMPDIDNFSQALVDICLYGKPVLSFMDGIVGMEGAGPSAGDPRKIGAVIASTSPYHLDVVATSIINLEPTKVPTIKRTVEMGLCKGNLEDINLLGDNIKDFKIKDFKIPPIRTVHMVKENTPKIIRKISDKLLKPRPIFIHDDCIGCGDCKESCPPKVIDMVDNRPEVNLDECIRCFCCQELCPKKAVEIYRPTLMKLLSKL